MILMATSRATAPLLRLLGRLAGPPTMESGGYRLRYGAGDERVWVLGSGDELNALQAHVPITELRKTRVVVLGLKGTHPDARSPALRQLWHLEEESRATFDALLVLRLGPLLGKQSPLWWKLRSRPALPKAGRKLLNPVVEDDVVETLRRGLDEPSLWHGWYEIVGPETWSLKELVSAAENAQMHRDGGCWEPDLEILEEQGLGEHEPWSRHFRVSPRLLSTSIPEWTG